MNNIAKATKTTICIIVVSASCLDHSKVPQSSLQLFHSLQHPNLPPQPLREWVLQWLNNFSRTKACGNITSISPSSIPWCPNQKPGHNYSSLQFYPIIRQISLATMQQPIQWWRATWWGPKSQHKQPHYLQPSPLA